MSDVLPKPFSKLALKAVIERFCAHLRQSTSSAAGNGKVGDVPRTLGSSRIVELPDDHAGDAMPPPPMSASSTNKQTQQPMSRGGSNDRDLGRQAGNKDVMQFVNGASSSQSQQQQAPPPAQYQQQQQQQQQLQQQPNARPLINLQQPHLPGHMSIDPPMLGGNNVAKLPGMPSRFGVAAGDDHTSNARPSNRQMPVPPPPPPAQQASLHNISLGPQPNGLPPLSMMGSGPMGTNGSNPNMPLGSDESFSASSAAAPAVNGVQADPSSTASSSAAQLNLAGIDFPGVFDSLVGAGKRTFSTMEAVDALLASSVNASGFDGLAGLGVGVDPFASAALPGAHELGQAGYPQQQQPQQQQQQYIQQQQHMQKRQRLG
ncbi:hypothetical protein BCR44DRAFT_1037707 [Catenaria anguillulae PL171]|uniref:Uncharacterized protein n=1 Tax=Catenaria anguillulae PL171 TaxID=765915 RepID=A0A1Y2H5W9_9FUNG|nr:hypothetical protein BCR44DRAFT_1037707 [Catenaria anguillulae PL171]